MNHPPTQQYPPPGGQSYGMSQLGYGTPGVVVQQPGYGPQSGYGYQTGNAPQPGYGAPQPGYGAPPVHPNMPGKQAL